MSCIGCGAEARPGEFCIKCFDRERIVFDVNRAGYTKFGLVLAWFPLSSATESEMIETGRNLAIANGYDLTSLETVIRGPR